MIPKHELEALSRDLVRFTPFTVHDVLPLLSVYKHPRENKRIIEQFLEERQHLPIDTMEEYARKKKLKAKNYRKRPFPWVPKWRLERGITPQRGGRLWWEDIVIRGLDTETQYNDGHVHSHKEVETVSIQVVGDDCGSHFITQHISGEQFLDNLEKICPAIFPDDKVILFSAHNLPFDIYQVYYHHAFTFLDPKDTKVICAHFGAQSFVQLKWHKKHIIFFDTANFFKGKLKNVAKTWLPDLAKLEAPSFLGKREPQTPEEWEQYREYALRDALITLRLTEVIKRRQEDKQLPVCLTVASESVKHFKMHFLERAIPYPEKKILRDMHRCKYGAVSYALMRGFDTKPWYSYDVKGLYSWVMEKVVLPFEGPITRMYKKDLKDTAIVGWCKVRFRFPPKTYAPCLPVMLDKLYFPLEGVTWSTTYSVRLAQEMGAKIDFIEGWKCYATPGNTDHPLRHFVQENSRIKDEADVKLKHLKEQLKQEELLGHDTEEIKRSIQQQQSIRQQAKDHNNTIYGKTCEVAPNKKAGQLWHPGFSSLILDFARCRIIKELNRLRELGVKVCYVHTDSLLCDRNDFHEEYVKRYGVPFEGNVTGMFENETPKGVYPLIVRAKFGQAYDMESLDVKKNAHHSVQLTRNPDVKKQWNHQRPHKLLKGFQKMSAIAQPMDERDLRDTLLAGKGMFAHYGKQHWTRLKEGAKFARHVNQFNWVERTFDVMEDGLRIFEKEVVTFEGLREGMIDSVPPTWVQ